MPRFTAECVSWYTSNGTAHCVNELPRFEIVWPAQNFLKSEVTRPLAGSRATYACLAAALLALPPLVQHLRLARGFRRLRFGRRVVLFEPLGRGVVGLEPYSTLALGELLRAFAG